MQEAELEVPFAVLFGKALIDVPLDGEAAAIALRVALLSPYPDAAAQRMKPKGPVEGFLVGLARNDVTGLIPPDSLGRAIAAAFRSPALPEEGRRLLDENRKGEAILVAMDSIARGVQGDLRGVTEGLSLLRAAGLDSVARRTALELMILERRGRTGCGAEHPAGLWTRPCRLLRLAGPAGAIPGQGRAGRGGRLPCRLRCVGAVESHAGAAFVVDPPALPFRVRRRLARG
jgi:hypothetical protein